LRHAHVLTHIVLSDYSLKAYQADQLSGRDELTLKRNVFDRLDAESISKYESSKHEMTIREKLDHLKHERERMGGNTDSNHPSPQVPTQSATDATLHQKTGSQRQRLPEAIEAERRRAEATAKAPESK